MLKTSILSVGGLKIEIVLKLWVNTCKEVNSYLHSEAKSRLPKMSKDLKDFF